MRMRSLVIGCLCAGMVVTSTVLAHARGGLSRAAAPSASAAGICVPVDENVEGVVVMAQLCAGTTPWGEDRLVWENVAVGTEDAELGFWIFGDQYEYAGGATGSSANITVRTLYVNVPEAAEVWVDEVAVYAGQYDAPQQGHRWTGAGAGGGLGPRGRDGYIGAHAGQNRINNGPCEGFVGTEVYVSDVQRHERVSLPCAAEVPVIPQAPRP